MKSITKFFRRRGYGVKQVEGLLLNLRPLSPHHNLHDDECGTLEEIIRRMKRAPELSSLVNRRETLEEAGYQPILESEHTLKIPLPKQQLNGQTHLCFTRLSDEKWVCYRDDPAAPY